MVKMGILIDFLTLEEQSADRALGPLRTPNELASSVVRLRTLTLLVARESIAFAFDESLWLAQKCCLALHSRDCRNSFHNVRPRVLLPHLRMSAIAETEQILEEQTASYPVSGL